MLKGKTIIELTDVNTKEVQRIEDNNMFTNALDSLVNGAPHYFNNPILYRPTFPDNTKNVGLPVFKELIGGLLLFPEELEEDANLLYAPASNKPIGIASNDAYSGTDLRRGSFAENESGRITNGYRFVWNFSTAQANGEIKCVSLTSARGGKAYFDNPEDLLLEERGRNARGQYRTIRINGVVRPRCFGADDEYMYFCESYGAELRVFRQYCPKHKLALFTELTNDTILPLKTEGTRGVFTLYGGSIIMARSEGNESGNATLYIDKYSKDDMSLIETKSFTLSDVHLDSTSRRGSYRFAIANDYAYLRAYEGRGTYKINMSNPADVTLIQIDGINAASIGDDVICPSGYIESDDTAHPMSNVELGCIPVDRDGVWLINNGEYDDNTDIAATILTPYLATINNLGSGSVIKRPTQSMKVTYIVTEV